MAINFSGPALDSLEGNPELSQENIDAMNQMLEQSVGTDMNGSMEILGYINFGVNVLYIAMFIASAIGLYKLSKKLGDKHSWLAFIPLIQIYTYIKTAGYNFWKGLIMLVLYGILSIFLTGIALVGIAPLLKVFATSGSTVSIIIVFLMSTLFITLLMILVATFFLYAGMARRAGQSGGTAILMALFPWCMLWIVANRTPQHLSGSHVMSPNTIEQTPVINTEL